MSNKGTPQSALTRAQISKSMSANRDVVLDKLKEYKSMLIEDGLVKCMPSIVSASLYAGMSKKALLAWELTTEENSELRTILDFIRDLEELFLREQGLSGRIDSKLTTLLLKADHGITEKLPSLTQNNTFNISPELLAEALQLSRSTKK